MSYRNGEGGVAREKLWLRLLVGRDAVRDEVEVVLPVVAYIYAAEEGLIVCTVGTELDRE